jgi:hypothetical protein
MQRKHFDGPCQSRHDGAGKCERGFSHARRDAAVTATGLLTILTVSPIATAARPVLAARTALASILNPILKIVGFASAAPACRTNLGIGRQSLRSKPAYLGSIEFRLPPT